MTYRSCTNSSGTYLVGTSGQQLPIQQAALNALRGESVRVGQTGVALRQVPRLLDVVAVDLEQHRLRERILQADVFAEHPVIL